MASRPPLVFNGINSEQYVKLSEKARDAGIEISGNDGTASKYGVQISWCYVPGEQQLTFQCVKTPFYLSADDVEKRIRSVVEATLAA